MICECPPPTPPEDCVECGERPCVCEKEEYACDECWQTPCICVKKVKIRLAPGKELTITHTTSTTFYHPDGKPMSAQDFVVYLFGELPKFFKNEEELRQLWGDADTRSKLLEKLGKKGLGMGQLREMRRLIDAEDSDIYDVLAHVAFTKEPISRQERVEMQRDAVHADYDDKQREFLDFVLDQYVNEGVQELAADKLEPLLVLKYDTVNDAVDQLGPPKDIRKMFLEFQKHLYQEDLAA